MGNICTCEKSLSLNNMVFIDELAKDNIKKPDIKSYKLIKYYNIKINNHIPMKINKKSYLEISQDFQNSKNLEDDWLHNINYFVKDKNQTILKNKKESRERKEEQINFTKQIEERLFTKTIILYINLYRRNINEFSDKIKRLSEKIKKDPKNSMPYLYYDNKGEFNKVYLTKGTFSFKDTIEFLNNTNEELEKLEEISDVKITLEKNSGEGITSNIYKNAEFLIKELQPNYEIIALNIVHLKSFDDPELAIFMNIIDGEQSKELRKNIFSKYNTHISVNCININENERVIYYLFAKKINSFNVSKQNSELIY